MAKAAAVKVPDILEVQDYEQGTALISEDRRIQNKRFIRAEDAYRSLLGELLARAIICQELGVSNRNVHFSKNNYGKPMVCGHEEFYFNISHSGCWVVMIWGQTSVGIDVEHIQHADLEIAKRFFSSTETQDLLSKPESERKKYFYDLWTLKESYIKALGTGLSTPLDSFSIRLHPEGDYRLDPDLKTARFAQVEIDPAYRLSICTLGDEPRELIDLYDYRELINILI